jgi:hypothetical protein
MDLGMARQEVSSKTGVFRAEAFTAFGHLDGSGLQLVGYGTDSHRLYTYAVLFSIFIPLQHYLSLAGTAVRSEDEEKSVARGADSLRRLVM